MTRRLTLLLLLFLAMAATVLAEDEPVPEITDIIVTTSEQDLLLFATVKNCFTTEMVQGVRNGLPITFTFQVELDRVRNNWFDSTIEEFTVTHTLRYDSLKQEYLIDATTRQGNARRTTGKLEEAKQLMAELNGVPVSSLDRLTPESPYALRIKATLEENTLPLGMHYVLPFTSLWNFETDWRTIEFRY